MKIPKKAKRQRKCFAFAGFPSAVGCLSLENQLNCFAFAGFLSASSTGKDAMSGKLR